MSAYKNLVEARARIAEHKNWVKGNWAKYGRYCAIGALFGEVPAVTRVILFEALQAEFKYLVDALPDNYDFPPTFKNDRSIRDRIIIQDYNDKKSTTHADILAMYDRAIEKAAADEGISKELENKLEPELSVDSQELNLVRS